MVSPVSIRQFPGERRFEVSVHSFDLRVVRVVTVSVKSGRMTVYIYKCLSYYDLLSCYHGIMFSLLNQWRCFQCQIITMLFVSFAYLLINYLKVLITIALLACTASTSSGPAGSSAHLIHRDSNSVTSCIQ